MENSIPKIYFNQLLKKVIQFRLFVFFSLAMSSGFTQAQDTIRIMPLGNSITYGTQCTNGDIFNDCTDLPNEDAVGYRDSLGVLIDSAGVFFDYVGSESSGSNFLADPDHAGFPGITSDDLATLLETGGSPHTGQITDGPYLNFYPTDIIVLHIGTNDILAGDTTDVSGVERILDAIDAYEASSGRTVMVFLATALSQAGDPCGTNQGVTSFNSRLDSLFQERSIAGDSLRLLDFECGLGLDYFNDFVDQVHPNDTGYDKMADGWFAEIDTFLKVAVRHPVTTTAGANGTIDPSGVVYVYEGDDPVFTITPDTGYNIENVTVNGVPQGPISSYQFTDVEGDSAISATFVIKEFEITTSVTGNGSINPAGPLSVTYGSDQTFTMDADPGYEVTDVLVDGVSVGAVTSYTFNNITSDHSISATFDLITYTITATATGNGTIDPAGDVTVAEGGSQLFAITPDADHEISDVEIDGVSEGPVSSYEFTNVNADRTIEAFFAPITHTITATAGPNGSITPAGAVSVNQGNDQTFTITPDEGYDIDDVEVNGISQGPVSSYTFTDVSGDSTISASFIIQKFEITTSVTGNGSISPPGPVTVDYGSDLSFSIIPDAGHAITNVFVDGIGIGAVTSYTFENVTEPHTISATFEVITHVISATATGNGTISPSGNISVNEGADQSFTITPDEDHEISDVEVNGISIGAVSTYEFVGVTSDQTIEAFFAPITHTITATADANGSISPSGTVTVNQGDNQGFTITPDIGYDIDDVLVNGASQGPVTNYTFIDVNTDHTISASFKIKTFEIIATVTGNGTINPSGTVVADYGTSETFTITPSSGYEITDVTVDGASIGVTTSYTFSNITANHTISATFEAITYTIVASANGNGSINPSGSVSVNEGDNQSFAITPDPDHEISDVEVNGISVGAVSTYDFVNVNSNHTIEAFFVPVTHTISASAGSNGSISPSGTITVNQGDDQPFTITPDVGYEIDFVLVDGTDQGAISSYTFNNVNTDHSIFASFNIRTFTITTSVSGNGSITPAGPVSVDYGSSQTFTITPDVGYEITDVVVDGTSVGVTSSYTFNNVTASHTISATFSAVFYTINATSGPNGSISPSGNVNVLEGSNQTFTISPAPDFDIDDVLVDGVSQGATPNYTFNNVSSNHTISASFKPITHTILASSGPNGSISPSGTVVVNQGSDRTFNFTPNTGYEVADVLVDGVSVGAPLSYTFNNVSISHTISVSFALKSYEILATAGPEGNISPDGSVSVDHGDNQTFSITPLTGYEIDDVLVDGISVGPVANYTFNNVITDHTITASFVIKTYTINATSGPNGSISPSGNISVDHGSSRTFSITPQTGYEIDDVLVNGLTVGPVSSYTFSNVTSDQTISATFVRKTYTISSTSGLNGSISPSGNVIVDHGDDQVFSITPATGYEIEDVLVDGLSVGAVSEYTFSNVTTNHTIEASFVIKTYTILAFSGSNGSITPSGSVSVDHGSDQTFIFIPSTGYEVSNVRIDGVNIGPASSYTFSNVITDHTISVTFVIKTYTISAVAGSNGSIDPPGDTEVDHGSSLVYDIIPDEGYEIEDVLVDGVSIGPVTSYTFSNVTTDHSISASFVLKTYIISASSGPNGDIDPPGNTEVDHGSSLTYTFLPDEGYEIEDVLVDGLSVGVVDSYTFTNITEGHTISVSFIIKTYTIAATSGLNGAIDPPGISEVEHGSSLLYTFIPDEGYEVEDVVVDGVSIGAVDEYTFLNVTENHTISVSFILKTYIITSSSGPNGTISPLGETEVDHGSSQIYTFIPDEGYEVEDVIVDGISIGVVDEYTFSNITEAHTISVSFVIQTFIITSAAGENGTITPLGETELEYGTDQVYTITPDEGYEIEDVIVDGVSIGVVDEYTFTNITEEHTISATFIIKTYIITSSAGENGVISPEGETEVEHFSDITYTFIPDEGYEVLEVIVDGISIGAVDEYSFTDISGPHTISVSFILKTYIITSIAGPNGNITPLGETEVDHGTSLEFTITPDAGYAIDDVIVNGTTVGSPQIYTFSNISSEHTIEVIFIKVIDIVQVTIPDVPMKISDEVTATLEVITDAGIPYALVSGEIGGYALSNLQRVDSTTYTADFSIIEDGNSYTAGQNIPVTNLILTDATVTNDPFDGFIVQDEDPIDAKRPIINFVWVEAGNKRVGETVRLIINADNNNYTIDSTSLVNGIPVTDPNIVFAEVGSGTYSLEYTILEGDNDVEAGELKASIVLVKPSGNINEPPYTLVNNSSELTIDANSPVVTTMVVSGGEVGIGDVVEVTITTDGTGYNVGSGTVINEIPISSSRVSFTEQSDGVYILSYTVAIGDNTVPTGALELTLYLEDAAGNSAGPFTKLEPNSLSIYTELPTATIAGTQSVCEEEPATLTVYLSGRAPWSIFLSDGSVTTQYSDINTNIFSIEVFPEKTTIYRIELVSDANGTLNTGTGNARVSLLEKTDVEITNTKTTFSRESDPVQLEANVSGGVFTGAGVNSETGIFDPAVADTLNSPHMIYFSYENAFGCTSIDSILMFVLGAQGDLFIPKSFYCGYEQEFTITATNLAEVTGSFRLLNSDGNEVEGLVDSSNNTAMVDPGLLTDGSYTVEYAYFDEVTLYLRESFIVETVEEPVILLPDEDEFCQNGPPVELSGSVAGAIFEGPGVSGNTIDGFVFDPGQAFIGNNEILLSNTSMSGCTVSASKTLKVNEVPNIYFIVDKFCVSSRDTVFFSNTTMDKYLFSSWSWDFDDPESGERNISTDEAPYHIYNEAGTRTVKLMGQTESGCVDSVQRVIDFGDNPKGSISWDTECFVESGPIEFTSELNSSNNIVKYQWEIIEPEGDTISINGGKTINYGFDEMDRYNIRVTGETEIGCIGSAERQIVLKPIIQLTPDESYTEDFNIDDGWWSADMEDSSAHLSWDYRVVNFENMGDELSKGWYTRLPTAEVNEYSWVNSPCFDFSEVDRPMISMDIYQSLSRNNEGVVLQATTDGGQNWQAIGKENEGKNWYNSSVINPGPGGQQLGWTGEDPFQADAGWTDARNDINFLAGEENVQFRLAYASEHSSIVEEREGFAFDNVRIGNRTRKVLLEHFTNTASNNTREIDGVVNNIYNTYYGDMVKLEYHTSFPGSDPFNEHNSSVPATRALYYGVNSVPYSIIDGGYTSALRFNFNPGEFDTKAIQNQYLGDALFDIEISAESVGSQVNVEVNITATENLDAAERIVHIVVFEKLITGISTINGATNFLNVVKDMLPNGAGTAEFGEWFKGQVRTYQYTWDAQNVYNPDMIRVAAFVQDDGTKEVYQVSANDSINLTTSVSPDKARLFSVNVYPNPAEDYLYVHIKTDERMEYEVEIYDQVGRMVMNEQIYDYEDLKQINIEPLDKGVYYIRVKTGDMIMLDFEKIVIMN